MSLYIRVYTDYWHHRKTVKLQSILGADAVWLPIRLWSYAAEHQPDGCFSQYSSMQLALLMQWHKDACAMLQALQECGFMDEMNIHNWNEHNGFHKKMSERGKKGAAARWTPSPQTPLPEEERKRDRDRASIACALPKQCLSIPDSEEEELTTFLSRLKEMGLERQWDGFEEVRKKKRAVPTPLARLIILRELFKHPSKVKLGLERAIQSNWTGFKWEWVDKDLKSSGKPKTNVSKPAEPIEVPNLIEEMKLRRQREEAARSEGCPEGMEWAQ